MNEAETGAELIDPQLCASGGGVIEGALPAHGLPLRGTRPTCATNDRSLLTPAVLNSDVEYS